MTEKDKQEAQQSESGFVVYVFRLILLNGKTINVC